MHRIQPGTRRSAVAYSCGEQDKNGYRICLNNFPPYAKKLGRKGGCSPKLTDGKFELAKNLAVFIPTLYRCVSATGAL